MNRSSRSVYTVTRSTYLPGVDEMSDISYIDVDDDDDYVGSDLSSTSNSVKPATGNLYEAKQQVSDHHRDLSERGVFDYFSSPLTLGCSSTNRAQEPSFQPQNHYYLGPGCSASLQNSGARKFVEMHRQADATTSSDEEVRGSSYKARWSPSSHERSVDDSPSLDSQWVRQQYNQHVRQANTQCYDEAVLCNDPDNYLTQTRPLSPVSSKETNNVDFLSSRSSVRDTEPVLSRRVCSDMSHDVCDSSERLKLIKETDAYRDSAMLCSDLSDVNYRVDHTSSSPATQSFLLRSASRNSKDISDTVSHQLSSSGQSWPISARSSDSYNGHTAGSHQNAVCRSSELSPTVVNAVGSVRCSTGVDTGVGFPLSAVSSRSSQAHLDVGRLSSSGQSTVSSGLETSHWPASNGLQAIANYSRSYDGSGPLSYIGRSMRYDDLTLRKNSQDDDTYGLYGLRGNESDGEDGFSGVRRNDPDITSNVDILHRRGKDYESGSGTTVRPFISTPQYHLTPTEEEETERRQSARGQQLERMKCRRNARLSRQSAGVSKADTVPGFRGEASLEELISYIDAPALAVNDCKTVRKAKKKKKKVALADNSDSSAQKLANSCEVFVGTSGVSSDEPSVRVGDSCCIELRKKSGSDSLPDTASTPVSAPDSYAYIESGEGDKNTLATSTDSSQSTGLGADTSHLDVEITEGLPEVGYATVRNTVLEDENIPEISTESIASTSTGDETLLAASIETAEVLSEVASDRNQTAADVDQVSVESCETTKMTDSSLTVESSCECVGAALPAVIDKEYELDNIPPLVTASDSVTSDTGSVEDLFVTVQKKKRTKNTTVTADDPWPRFGRRSSGTKVVEDTNYYVKRSWVKSSDASSIVPSVNVSRSSIVCCKSLCTVTRSGVAVGQYSQASHHDTVLSSTAAAGKCPDRSSSSALSAEAEPNSIKQQSSNSKPIVTDSVCTLSSDRITTSTTHRSKECEKNELKSDSVTPVTSTLPADGIITTRWQACSQKELVCECDNTQDSYASSDVPTEMRDATSYAKSVDVTACDKLNECSAKTDVQINSVANNLEVCSETVEDQLDDARSSEGKAELLQLSVQNVSASDVFLDTRNIAGTTPPRSDISFGFDLTTSPEPADAPVSQHVSAPGATFTPTVAGSCHCPVVAPMPPAVPGCAPLLYFYPAMPVTILPPVATFPTGRCTPVGVVPPMPAVADPSDIPVAPPVWQQADDKVISVPLPQDEQNIADNNTVASDVTAPSMSNKTTNEFVLYAAQRYLYSEFEKVLLESSQTSLPHECLVVHYSSLEAAEEH